MTLSAPRGALLATSIVSLGLIVLCQGCEKPAGAGDSSSRSIKIPGEGGRGGLEVERVGPTEVRLGEPFTFQVRIENEGKEPIEGLELRPMSQGLRILSTRVAVAEERRDSAAPAQPSSSALTDDGAQPATWKVGALLPGEKKVLEVTAAAVARGDIESCVLVSYAPRLCEKIKVVEPQLVVESLLEDEWRDRAYVCGYEKFDLVYRVKNVGTGKSAPLRIHEELPEGLATDDGKKVVDIDVGEVGEGDTVEKKVTLKAERAGVYERNILASGPQLEVRSTARLRVVRPELLVKMEAPPAARVDEPVSFRTIVQNTGRDIAPGVKLEVDGAREFTVMGGRADGKEILLGDIPPGESREIAIVTRFDKADDQDLGVKVTGICADRLEAKARTRITGIPAMRIEVVDLEDPVAIGKTTQYEVRVKNQGSAPDTNVVLQAKIPAELEFVEARGETRAEAPDGHLVRFATVKELGAGDEVRWRIDARAVRSGQAQFEVEVRSAGNPEPVIEREPTTVP
jgi:uncharacterized repeat protein (TIGR01451 family)